MFKDKVWMTSQESEFYITFEEVIRGRLDLSNIQIKWLLIIVEIQIGE